VSAFTPVNKTHNDSLSQHLEKQEDVSFKGRHQKMEMKKILMKYFIVFNQIALICIIIKETNSSTQSTQYV